MKHFFLTCVVALWLLVFLPVGFAQDPEFELLPEATDTDATKTAVDALWNPNNSRNFWELYNQKARELGTTEEKKWLFKRRVVINECGGLGNQFASWIMNRDTILCLASQVVRFVSNMALVVWALMIVYAGYMYATSVFSGENVNKGTEAIKFAIIGIVIIIFSYAILNLLLNAFL